MAVAYEVEQTLDYEPAQSIDPERWKYLRGVLNDFKPTVLVGLNPADLPWPLRCYSAPRHFNHQRMMWRTDKRDYISQVLMPFVDAPALIYLKGAWVFDKTWWPSDDDSGHRVDFTRVHPGDGGAAGTSTS